MQEGTLISLLDTGDCNLPEGNIAQQDAHIELLQRLRNASVDVLACRIKVENIYEKLTNNKANAKQPIRNVIKNDKYYIPIDVTACLEVHTYKRLTIQNVTFNNLVLDVVNSRTTARYR